MKSYEEWKQSGKTIDQYLNQREEIDEHFILQIRALEALEVEITFAFQLKSPGILDIPTFVKNGKKWEYKGLLHDFIIGSIELLSEKLNAESKYIDAFEIIEEGLTVSVPNETIDDIYIHWKRRERKYFNKMQVVSGEKT